MLILNILPYYFGSLIAKTRLTNILLELEKFNTFWKENITKLQNIEEILSGIESIHKKISKISLFKKYASTKQSLYALLEKQEVEYFIQILTDLRSDLQLRLTEQQSLLESAKSEVKSYIKGTTELKQVSELQRARLDKQIEQFEELQRVLVKM